MRTDINVKGFTALQRSRFVAFVAFASRLAHVGRMTFHKQNPIVHFNKLIIAVDEKKTWFDQHP